MSKESPILRLRESKKKNGVRALRIKNLYHITNSCHKQHISSAFLPKLEIQIFTYLILIVIINDGKQYLLFVSFVFRDLIAFYAVVSCVILV